jgi:PAS domain S-box-containing protein
MNSDDAKTRHHLDAEVTTEKWGGRFQFSCLADTFPSPVCLLDSGSRYLDCNNAYADFFRVRRQEIIGKPVFHELPWAAAGDGNAPGSSTTDVTFPCQFETRCSLPCGQERYLIVNASGADLGDGPSGVLCVITDISEIKHTEQELRRVSGMLEAVIKASPLPIMMIDTDFYVRLWNPAAECCFGFSRDQVIDRMYPLWPDPEQEAAEALKRFNNDEVLYGSEVLRKKSDGTLLRVKRYTAPVRDREGALIGTMAVLEDLTEQRRTESELLQAGKLAAIGELAAGIAHEINNPNMFIMTNAQVVADVWRDAAPLLRRDTAEQPGCLLAGLPASEALESMPKLLDGIVEGSLRIQRIVGALKDFCRQEETNGMSQVAVAKILEGAVFMLENQIKRSTDCFSLSCDSGLPPVIGIFHQLEQVVINVVLNALQSLPDRGRAVQLSASRNRETGMVEITVRDEGRGMTQETLDHIADPFFSTRLDKGGLGLGLSISNRIIRRHGGTLRFESRSGVGTTVVIVLPAAPDQRKGGEHG